MQESSCRFNFRAWLLQEDCHEVFTWYQGLEPMDAKSRPVADWALESLSNNDLYDLFDLDKSKDWQVVGTASIRGWFDFFGEYDEEITVEDMESVEIPAEWIKEYFDIKRVFRHQGR